MIQILCAIMLSPVMLLGATAHAGDLPLQVEIKPAQATKKNDDVFPVDTTIRNVGNQRQTLWIWSCSYPDHWRSDNPRISVLPVYCKKNFLQRTVLKPGKAYGRELSVSVEVPLNKPTRESVTFRLGFMPWTQEDESPPYVWSNPVTLEVATRQRLMNKTGWEKKN